MFSERITRAIVKKAGTLDYTPAFQLGHRSAFATGRGLADDQMRSCIH